MNHIFKLIASFIFIFLSSFTNGQGQLIWSFTTGGRVYSSPTADENTLYIGSNDSCLYAINKSTGILIWKYSIASEIKSKPLLHKGNVIFNSANGIIYCIDKKDTHLKWKFKTEGEKCLDRWDYYLSTPVYSANRVFVGSSDGNVYALDADNGKLVWKFKTGGIVHATPLIYNNRVYIGSYDGYMYALNANDGSLVWKFKTIGDEYFPKGEIQKGAAIYKNSVIFGSRDFYVYSLDIETGSELWKTKEKGSWVIATPLVVRDTIYFGTSDSHRFCGLQANTGKEIGSHPLNMRVYGEAVDSESSIYFGCFNGKLYRLDLATGKLEAIFQTSGSTKNYSTVYNEKDEFRSDFELYGNDIDDSEKKILNLGAILSTPLIENGIIYFADANGVVYAYKLD